MTNANPRPASRELPTTASSGPIARAGEGGRASRGRWSPQPPTPEPTGEAGGRSHPRGAGGHGQGWFYGAGR